MCEKVLRACRELTAFSLIGEKRVLTEDLFNSIVEFAYNAGRFDGIMESSKPSSTESSSANLPVQPE